MRTAPSGVRATGQSGEHVARPVYSLKGVNLHTATESTCRTCAAPIAKTDQDDGLRGSWRHTGSAPVILPDTELVALVHEANARNLKYLVPAEEALALAKDAYDAAWRRQRADGYTISVPGRGNSGRYRERS